MGKDRRYDVVAVEWEDPVGHSGWHSESSGPKAPDKCLTVGIARKRCRKHILVTQSLSSDKMVDNDILIPRACIKSVRKIGQVAYKDEGEE